MRGTTRPPSASLLREVARSAGRSSHVPRSGHKSKPAPSTFFDLPPVSYVLLAINVLLWYTAIGRLRLPYMWYIAGLVPALFSTPIERRNRSVGVFLSEVCYENRRFDWKKIWKMDCDKKDAQFRERRDSLGLHLRLWYAKICVGKVTFARKVQKLRLSSKRSCKHYCGFFEEARWKRDQNIYVVEVNPRSLQQSKP